MIQNSVYIIPKMVVSIISFQNEIRIKYNKKNRTRKKRFKRIPINLNKMMP